MSDVEIISQKSFSNVANFEKIDEKWYFGKWVN